MFQSLPEKGLKEWNYLLTLALVSSSDPWNKPFTKEVSHNKTEPFILLHWLLCVDLASLYCPLLNTKLWSLKHSKTSRRHKADLRQTQCRQPGRQTGGWAGRQTGRQGNKQIKHTINKLNHMLCIYLSLSVYPSIYLLLSVCLFVCLSILFPSSSRSEPSFAAAVVLWWRRWWWNSNDDFFVLVIYCLCSFIHSCLCEEIKFLSVCIAALLLLHIFLCVYLFV